MAKCPECGSRKIEQYMMPYGPMWCLECGFRVEEKYEQPNPFLNDEDDEAVDLEPAGPRLSLGAAMAQMAKGGKKRPAKDAPEEDEGDEELEK